MLSYLHFYLSTYREQLAPDTGQEELSATFESCYYSFLDTYKTDMTTHLVLKGKSRFLNCLNFLKFHLFYISVL